MAPSRPDRDDEPCIDVDVDVGCMRLRDKCRYLLEFEGKQHYSNGYGQALVGHSRPKPACPRWNFSSYLP